MNIIYSILHRHDITYHDLGNSLKHEKCNNTETPVKVRRKREELLLNNYMEIS